MSVMDEAVEDGIGDASAAEELVPVADRELGSDHGGSGAVALFEGLEQILLFPVGEGRKAEVIDQDDRDLREPLQQPIVCWSTTRSLLRTFHVQRLDGLGRPRSDL